MFMTAWYTSLADPMEMYGVLQTGEFSNYGSWSDPEFDAQIDQAIADPIGEPARTTAMANAQQIAAEQLPWLPLYAPPTTLFLGDRITGVAAVDRLHVLPVGRDHRSQGLRSTMTCVRGPQARGHGAHACS